MFEYDGILYRSTLLDLPSDAEIRHGFSTKHGGVSTHPYTKSMNLAPGREDSDETVRQNIRIFANAITDGKYDESSCVCAHQIHSSVIRTVHSCDRGDGAVRPSPIECDGFVTDEKGILIFIRIADCTPILLAGTKADGSPVISAVHAGWRGTAKAIASEAVRKMTSLGCEKNTIKAAIGANIKKCCYEVGEDLYAEVSSLRGEKFASEFITPSDTAAGKFMCDMTGMNLSILLDEGISESNIDICPLCTMCHSDIFHSHRKTNGKRGAMGAGIIIM